MPSIAKICYEIAFLTLVVFIFPVVTSYYGKKLIVGDKPVFKFKKDYADHELGSGAMFDELSIRYDMVNTVLALGMDKGWRQEMVNVIRDHVYNMEKPTILDVATGTAEVAIQLATTIPFATIIGIDPSANMLQVGRHKIHEKQVENRIQLYTGNAEKLSYSDNSFDGATISFGIRNVKDRTAALCEIHRVLKNDRKLCILEFSEPEEDGSVMKRFAKYFIRFIVPVVGSVLSGAPAEYQYLQKSIQHFPKPYDFIHHIQQLRCNTNDSEGDDATTTAASSSSSSSFIFNELRHLNFGSVQLYIMTTQK